jgi:hypothetical protein
MPTWETASDWDSAQSESGVAHESVSNTDHTDGSVIKQGYSYSSPLYSTNLVAYWPLHENSGDAAYDVWNTNDGTLNGDVSQGVTGILGSTAYNFDNGSYDEVVVSDGSFANVGTGDITISAWFRCTGTNGRNHIVNHRRSGTDPRKGFVFGGRNETLGFNFEDENDYQIKASGTNINDSTWHHVAVVKSGTSVTSYLDGAADASDSNSNFGNFDTSEEFRIGQTNDTDSAYPEAFDGDIAEVSVYTTALSQSQIQTLHDVVAANGTLVTDARDL